MIDGKGLTRRSPRPRRPVQAGDTPTSLGGGQPSGASPVAAGRKRRSGGDEQPGQQGHLP